MNIYFVLILIQAECKVKQIVFRYSNNIQKSKKYLLLVL